MRRILLKMSLLQPLPLKSLFNKTILRQQDSTTSTLLQADGQPFPSLGNATTNYRPTNNNSNRLEWCEATAREATVMFGEVVTLFTRTSRTENDSSARSNRVGEKDYAR